LRVCIRMRQPWKRNAPKTGRRQGRGGREKGKKGGVRSWIFRRLRRNGRGMPPGGKKRKKGKREKGLRRHADALPLIPSAPKRGKEKKGGKKSNALRKLLNFSVRQQLPIKGSWEEKEIVFSPPKYAPCTERREAKARKDLFAYFILSSTSPSGAASVRLRKEGKKERDIPFTSYLSSSGEGRGEEKITQYTLDFSVSKDGRKREEKKKKKKGGERFRSCSL